MIVVRLSDGLGNQMFQYATGRAIAEAAGVPLRFDTSWFEGGRGRHATERTLTVDGFDLTLDRATTGEIRGLIGLGPLSIPVAKRVARFRPRLAGRYLHYYREILAQTDAEITWPHRRRSASMLLELDEAYLHGFWQSPGYFEHLREELRAAFSVPELSGQNAAVAADIRESNSVGIHVRRGDFVEFGNALPVAYYEDAVEAVEARVDDPEYFVFSNGIDWARDNLPVEDATYVDWNDGSTDYIDCYLLSQCDHTITANSTFSWWGGWLNDNEEKVVTTPEYWWSDDPTAGEHWDLVPADWTRVDPQFS